MARSSPIRAIPAAAVVAQQAGTSVTLVRVATGDDDLEPLAASMHGASKMDHRPTRSCTCGVRRLSRRGRQTPGGAGPDKITTFAGSMNFVYIHAVLFALWMLVFEKSPWPTLTLIVSLEAIFRSTFVMIGQNRQAAFQQAKADEDYKDVNTLLEENTRLTRLVPQLTKDVYARLIQDAPPPAANE
jgi:uncharacterized membrane protein